MSRLRCGLRGQGQPALAAVAGNPSNAAAAEPFPAGESPRNRPSTPPMHAAGGLRRANSPSPETHWGGFPRRPPSSLRAKHLHCWAPPLPPLSPLQRWPLSSNLVRPDVHPVGNLPSIPAQPNLAWTGDDSAPRPPFCAQMLLLWCSSLPPPPRGWHICRGCEPPWGRTGSLAEGEWGLRFWSGLRIPLGGAGPPRGAGRCQWEFF
jgi:hypothetical protein